MNQIIELVFISKNKTKTQSAIDELLKNEIILSGTIASESSTYELTLPIELAKFSINQHIIFIKLNQIKNKYFTINLPLVIINNYKSEATITIFFELSDITYKESTLLNSLINFSKTFAKKHALATYYAGLEPAEDLETRLFTNDKIGPLVLDDFS